MERLPASPVESPVTSVATAIDRVLAAWPSSEASPSNSGPPSARSSRGVPAARPARSPQPHPPARESGRQSGRVPGHAWSAGPPNQSRRRGSCATPFAYCYDVCGSWHISRIGRIFRLRDCKYGGLLVALARIFHGYFIKNAPPRACRGLHPQPNQDYLNAKARRSHGSQRLVTIN